MRIWPPKEAPGVSRKDRLERQCHDLFGRMGPVMPARRPALAFCAPGREMQRRVDRNARPATRNYRQRRKERRDRESGNARVHHGASSLSSGVVAAGEASSRSTCPLRFTCGEGLRRGLVSFAGERLFLSAATLRSTSRRKSRQIATMSSPLPSLSRSSASIWPFVVAICRSTSVSASAGEGAQGREARAFGG